MRKIVCILVLLCAPMFLSAQGTCSSAAQDGSCGNHGQCAGHCPNQQQEHLSRKEKKARKAACYIVQLADPQLGFNESGNIQSDIDNLNRAVDVINRLKPDFVVSTGDNVTVALDEHDTQLFFDCVKRLDPSIPIYYTPGNHDIHKLTPEVFQFWQKHYGEDRFSFHRKGSAYIGLNSTIVHEGPSDMEQEQFAWLEKELQKAQKCRHKFVFCHIPVVSERMDEPDSYNSFPLSIRQKYFDLFHQYGVQAVFCGHLHRNGYVVTDKRMEIVASNALGRSFTQVKPGLTIIRVGKEDYRHTYYSLEDAEKITVLK